MQHRGITVLVLFALSPVTLAAADYPDYTPSDATVYPSYQKHRELGAAVVPIFDAETQNRYLGINFLAAGYLPVYVIIKNASLNSVFLLRDQMLYKYDESQPFNQLQLGPRPDTSPSADITALSAALTGGVVPAVIALHLVSNVSKVRMNLLKKELRSQTIAPAEKAGGFVFVPVGKGARRANKLSLLVPIKSGEGDIDFNYRIDVIKAKR